MMTADGAGSALNDFYIVSMNLVEHLDLTSLMVRDTFLAETTNQLLDSLLVIEAHTCLPLGFDLKNNLSDSLLILPPKSSMRVVCYLVNQ